MSGRGARRSDGPSDEPTDELTDEERRRADHEAALIAAATAGERGALEELLASQIDRVHAVCAGLCRDRSDAEDATQDALIAIARGVAGFGGRSSFSTWCHRIAVNAAIDELRRRRRRPEPVDLDDRLESPGDRFMVAGSGTDPADAAVAESDRRSLRAALDDLPDEFRVPVVLRDVADLDYAEIASILDIPPGTVRSRIARGRARLATALGSGEAGSVEGVGNRTAGADVESHRRTVEASAPTPEPATSETATSETGPPGILRTPDRDPNRP